MRISSNDRFDAATPTDFEPPSRTAYPLTDANTVALWYFNEGTGTALADSSANTNTGTINNGTWEYG